MLLWERDNSPAVCKVGIAGDFLPIAGLRLPAGSNWATMSRRLARHFDDLDIAFVNLECPVSVDESAARLKLGLGANFSAPAAALDFLSPLHANVVSLANNHIYDYGSDGVRATREALHARTVTGLGAGNTLQTDPETYVWEHASGIRIGFWAAARGLPELASHRKPGIEPATTQRGAQALAALHQKKAQLRIALLHTGLEHTNRPEPADVLLMDTLAVMGFDLVAAAHSHRISGCRQIGDAAKPAYCFYGLGSLTSGILYSPLEREGIVAVLSVDHAGELVRVEARPVYLTETGWGGAPEPLHLEFIEQRFISLSREITDSSYKEYFYRDMSKGLLRRQLRDLRSAVRNGGIKGIVGKLARLRMRHLQRVVGTGLAMIGSFRKYLPLGTPALSRTHKS